MSSFSGDLLVRQAWPTMPNLIENVRPAPPDSAEQPLYKRLARCREHEGRDDNRSCWPSEGLCKPDDVIHRPMVLRLASPSVRVSGRARRAKARTRIDRDRWFRIPEQTERAPVVRQCAPRLDGLERF